MKHHYFKSLLLTLLIAFVGSAFAQTAAGVIITNQASADFIDSGGNGQTTLSNPVEVVVLPVYSFNIEPDNTLNPTGGAANNGEVPNAGAFTPDPTNTLTDVDAGSTVQFSYTLDNDANINDVFDLEVIQDPNDDFDFTGIQIYTFDDLDNDGVYDPGEPLSIQGNTTATLSLGPDDGAGVEDGGAGPGLAGNDSVNIVVFATVPPGTPGGDVANLDLVATSQGATTAGDTDPNVLYENNNVAQATVRETPVIGIAKRVNGTPTNNGNGTYTVTYELLIENLGNVDLEDVTITDDLEATFGAGLNPTVTTAPTLGATTGTVALNFDGSYTGTPPNVNILAAGSTIGVGATASITFSVTVTNPNIGTVYDNQAIVTGNSTGPGDATVGDFSDNGDPTTLDPDPNGNSDPGADSENGELPGSDADDADEDTPTPVQFTENPLIGISKVLNSVTPVVGSPGEFNVAFTLRIENFGDVPLSNIQVTEDLNAAFDVGNTDVVSVTAGPTTPANTNLGNPGFTLDGTYNGTGNNDLLTGANNLAVDDFTTIAFTVRIDIDSDGPGNTPAGPGSYVNTATAEGDSPSGTTVDDDSQNGTDPDPNNNDDPTDDNDPTPINITEQPLIGVAKDVGLVQDNGNGSYNVPYIITVTNYGNVDLSDVQVTDDLTATFVNPTNPQPVFNVLAGSVASPTLTPNAGFDGDADQDLLAGTDTLAVGATATITFTVVVEPNIAQGTYNNQAFAAGDSPGGTTVTDTSQDGTDPDDNSAPPADPSVNGDGDPSNNSDPTPVTIPSDPVIGVAKRLGTVTDLGGGTYEVQYLIEVENLGPIPLANVQVQDNLATTFGVTPFANAAVASSDAAALIPNNPGYDGSADINLLAAGSTLAVNTTVTLTLTVEVTPATLPTVQYDNQAFASATDPSGGLTTTDPSDNGFDPDPDGDGIADEVDDGVGGNGTDSDSNENDPTPLIILGPSDLDLVKTQFVCADAGCATVVAGGGAPGVDTQLTAEPGQFIAYTVTGTNNSGGADVTDVFINDIIPVPTVFVQSALNTVSSGVLECRTGAVWAACPTATPGQLEPAIEEVRLNDSGNSVADTASVTLTFVVQIP
ncbi:MAG: hypothetical protein AAF267_02695 [Deinococcota bacterium]